MKLINFLKSRQNIFYWLAFALGLAFLIILQYFGLIYYHYPVPPGHDAALHWGMAQPFYNNEVNLLSYLKSGAYPPGFLILIATLAHWFRTDTLQIMLWLTPAIIVFAAIVLFFLTKKIWGKGAALVSFYLYAFATTINIQQLNDGGYPNLIASQIILPILLLFSILLFQKMKLSLKIILVILLLSFLMLLPLTHHLTTLYLFAILILLLPIAILFFWVKNKWSIFKGLGALIFLIIIYGGIGFLLTRLPLFDSALNLFSSAFNANSIFPFIHIVGKIDPEAVISWKSLPSYIGQSIFIFGSIGIIVLPLIEAKRKTEKILPILVISIWSAILLVGSQMNFLSNPDRLARDAVYPLAILAGALIAYLFTWLWQKNRLGFAIILIFALVLTLIPVKRRLSTAFSYEPMVRITDADLEAINYLNKQPPGLIFIESYSFYFNRYLPNWGVGYLWDAQTVQSADRHALNPESENDLAKAKQYDYIYLIENQQGWIPNTVQLGSASNFLDNPNFVTAGHFISKTNEVYLFKVVH